MENENNQYAKMAIQDAEEILNKQMMTMAREGFSDVEISNAFDNVFSTEYIKNYIRPRIFTEDSYKEAFEYHLRDIGVSERESSIISASVKY